MPETARLKASEDEIIPLPGLNVAEVGVSMVAGGLSTDSVVKKAPVAPVTPLAPVAPVTPLAPVAPVTPLAPVAPVTPLAPVAPIDPYGLCVVRKTLNRLFRKL